MVAVMEGNRFADELRRWRTARRWSQLELALRAGTTQRHLSYMEQGRSRPGRGIILRLAESLELLLRERNALLLAAGYAPVFAESRLDGPELQPVREALDRILKGHLPYPAIVARPDGELVAANTAIAVLTQGAADHLLAPPINMLRLALHPDGLARRVMNMPEWGRHIIESLRSRALRSPDDNIDVLITELEGYVPPLPNGPDHIFEGSYLTERDASKVFLGIGIAGAGQPKVRGYKGSLQIVHSGDRVAVTLTSGRVAHFTVSGIYQNKFPLSDQTAFITMHEAEQLVPAVNDHATAIYVRTTPGTSAESVVSQLKSLKSGVQFETSATLSSSVQDQIATFNLISNILKVVSLLVAAITVFIVTYVDLVNKRRQIGIERAIGIRSAAIVTSYVVKASCYAIAGIGAGLACFNYVIVPLVRHRPFQFPNGPVALASTWQQIRQNLIILIIVALVSAAIPAIRSVRIKILDAIWEK